MNHFWSKDEPFIELFSLSHWIYIIFVILVFTFFIRHKNNIHKNPEPFRKGLLILSIIVLIVINVWYYIEYGWEPAHLLPLHLSRISSILAIVCLWTRHELLMNIYFYTGLFSYGTFAVPRAIYPFYHIIGMEFAVGHVLTIIIPFFFYIAYQWRPTLKGLHQAFAFFFIYLLTVNIVNPMVGANFFYLVQRPFNFLDKLPILHYNILVMAFTYGVFWVGYSLMPSLFGFLTKYNQLNENPNRRPNYL